MFSDVRYIYNYHQNCTMSIDSWKFGFEYCKTEPTPMSTGEIEGMIPFDGIADPQLVALYQSKAESINFLHTSSDMTCSVNIVCRFFTNASPTHMEHFDRLFRYMAGTSNTLSSMMGTQIATSTMELKRSRSSATIRVAWLSQESRDSSTHEVRSCEISLHPWAGSYHELLRMGTMRLWNCLSKCKFYYCEMIANRRS